MTAATFQSTVNIVSAFGVVGEIINDGPQRAEPLTLDSVGGAIGLAYTKTNTTNIATVGGAVVNGTSVFAGILVNPKVYASRGASGSPLDPSFTLPGFALGEFLTMGTIVVALTGAGNIGDLIQYNTTTGALSAVAPGSSASGGNALIANCVVYRYPTTAAGPVAIRITQ
jgi:hypothetical protein